MSADLAQRLRAYADEPCANGHVPIYPSTLREAATAIEERDALRAQLANPDAATRAAINAVFDGDLELAARLLTLVIDARIKAAQSK